MGGNGWEGQRKDGQAHGVVGQRHVQSDMPAGRGLGDAGDGGAGRFGVWMKVLAQTLAAVSHRKPHADGW
jgi:hypothetical protein